MQIMGHQINQQGLDRYWACPINVSGLDRESVEKLFDDDLFNLLQPTLSAANDRKAPFQVQREIGPLSYGRLHAVAEGRTTSLMKFLRQIGLNIDAGQAIRGRDDPLKFRCLAGDSHNGGKRPLVFDGDEGSWVLKFSDPRPYQLLAEVLGELSHGIGVNLSPPEIKADRDSQWYLIPYMESDKKSDHDIEAFMFSMGALIAVASCLRMVDLHLENLLVFEGRPIIIDPECILYNFSPSDAQERLLSTGLLSHNPSLSALRGGDVSSQEFVQIGLCETSGGILDYHKPVDSFHNRLHGRNGKPVDPSEHRQSLIKGFTSAFEWFLRKPDLVSDILKQGVPDDFRIRFLVRKTKLYVAAINMLNLPVACPYEDWRKGVFSQFKTAGYFPEKVSAGIIEAELDDMDARDVPYFWVNAGEKVIRHQTGVKQDIACRHNARVQAILDVHALRRSDLREQITVLENFLDTDLNGKIKIGSSCSS